MGLLDRIHAKPNEIAPPQAIDIAPNHDFLITWEGGRQVSLSSRKLRDACPCAACVEEFTGRKILDSGSIPADIRPTQLQPVGNYAVQIFWSDGHDSGIYTWQTLRKLSGL
jgi:DUF971 family protein